VDDHEREALLDSLNEDECRTLYWLCRGLSRADMAQRLFVSESAVYYRLAKIWEKLDIDLLERHVRLHVLVQDFCPLVLDRVEDPEHDCKRMGKAREDAVEEEAPSPETIETVKEDEETGLIPITQSIVRRPKRDPNDQPPIVIDYPGNPAPPHARRWLAPALLGIAFLLGVVAVLLVLNLTRQPSQQVVVVTSTLAPTQRSGETATPDAHLGSIPTEGPTYTAYPTHTPYPTQMPDPTHTPYPTYTPAPTLTPPPMPVASPTRNPKTLFEDGFDDGLKAGWEVLSGSPFVVNDQLSADEITWLLVGDPGWTEYSVQFHTDPNAYFFNQEPDMVGVRVANLDNMIVFAWSEYRDVWYIVKDGNWREVPNSGSEHGYIEKTRRIVVQGTRVGG